MNEMMKAFLRLWLLAVLLLLPLVVPRPARACPL